MVLSPVSAGEPLLVDSSPPSEMKVVKEIGFLERRKTAGPDGLTPFVSKDGGKVLTPDLNCS